MCINVILVAKVILIIGMCKLCHSLAQFLPVFLYLHLRGVTFCSRCENIEASFIFSLVYLYLRSK